MLGVQVLITVRIVFPTHLMLTPVSQSLSRKVIDSQGTVQVSHGNQGQTEIQEHDMTAMPIGHLHFLREKDRILGIVNTGRRISGSLTLCRSLLTRQSWTAPHPSWSLLL